MASQSANNGYQSNDNAAKAAHIYYAIMVTWNRLWEFAVKTIESPKSRLSAAEITEFKTMHFDFNEVVRFIENKWKKGSFDKLPNEKLLRSYLRRCPNIRNLVSHQRYVDAQNSNRAIETLCHVLEETGYPIDAQGIRDFGKLLTIQASDKKPPDVPWEQLKAQANGHYHEGQYTEAMIIYTEAIKDNPNEPVLYSNRALCELKLERFDDARNDAEDAIHLDPRRVKYHRILSEALEKLELFGEAYSVCEQGLRLGPTDATLLLRARDLSAKVAMQETDRNPRKDQKNAINGIKQLEEYMHGHFNEYAELKPDPIDIYVIDEAQKDPFFQNYSDLSKLIINAHSYRQGIRGFTKDDFRAFELYKEAADKGNAEGQYNTGVMYETRRNADYALMLKYYRLATAHKPFVEVKGQLIPQLGVAEAENGLGNAFRDGRGVDINMQEAFSHYIKAASWGLAQAQNNTGWCLHNGKGIAKNLEYARTWYGRAAEQGLAEAEMNYAEMLERGDGGPRNEREAFHYYQRAAKQGSPNAAERLQRLVLDGSASSTQKQDFSKRLKNSAAENDTSALYLLGTRCKENMDLDSAIKNWKRAADVGHLESQIALWQELLSKKRNSEAFDYCLGASKKGNAESQMILAYLLALGIGCKPNATDAKKWFSRARNRISCTSIIDMDVDELEKTINEAEKLCRYEEEHSLPTDGLDYTARIGRMIKATQILQPEIIEAFDNMSMVHGQPAPRPLQVRQLLGRNQIQELSDAAKHGSFTAQNIIQARKLLEDGFLAWEKGEHEKAFGLLRQSFRYDDVVTFADPEMVAYIDAQQLETADALFMKACSLDNDSTVHFLERCVRLYPLHADFHHLLSCHYGFKKEYEASIASGQRACELEPGIPSWLYCTATSMRLLYGNSPTKYTKESREKLKNSAIDVYLKYLKEAPKDDRKVPCALFGLAELCVEDNIDQAKEYYTRACDVDARRLGCFKPVEEDFPSKVIVRTILNLKTGAKLSPTSAKPETKNYPKGNMCYRCAKKNPAYVCVCHEVTYCGKECQKLHWVSHKPLCASKYTKLQNLHRF